MLALSFKLLAFSSCIEAGTALAEWRVKDGYEMIVRVWSVIICKSWGKDSGARMARAGGATSGQAG